MDKYYITHSAVSVRVAPAAEGKIVDVLKPNSIIRVVEEKNGWFKTISGKYVLHGEYIELLDTYNKRMDRDGNPNAKITLAKPRNVALNISPRASIDDIKDSTSVNLPNGAQDVNGTFIPVNNDTIYAVVPGSVNKDDGTIKIKSANGTQEYTVRATDVQIMVGTEWEDVQLSDEEIHQQQINSILEGLEDMNSYLVNSIADFTNMDIDGIRCVYGMPYQFTPIVDNRWDGSYDNKAFGRKYVQKIVARMPMMIMQAGIPEFLQGYNDEDKSKISSAIMSTFGLGEKDSDLQNVVNQSGKYYALRISSEDYYDCVNPMCRAIAQLLGLGDREITINGYREKLSSYRWQNVSQHPRWGYYQGSVSFYINSDAQVQETFSNGTTQSQMANRINQLGALGQEVQFLLGGVTNMTGFDLASYGKGSIGADGKVNLESSNGIIDNIIANAKTLIAGGRMIFPEIWSDSQFMRSYNVTLKFDSPDCDNLSLYLNILVPLCHILGFVQPRRVGNNVYISPFLVRAYYKSMFHVDMGIITECNITKGDVGAWNQNGLPNQITVQLTIKDLYNVLDMATNHGNNDLIGNPAQMDYLANLCGVNIAAPDIMRTLALWWIIRGTNRISDTVNNLWGNAINQVYRKWYNLTEFGRANQTM